VSALVIALHPSGSDGPAFQQSSHLNATADQHGFLVAYPTALLDSEGHTAWNGYFSDATFSGTPPDDVGFLRALINTLQANLSPDSKQIFVTGFSLGSLMTHRVGVELSDLVAAIAPYEYSMYGFSPPTLGGTIPNAKMPISVLMIFGSHVALPDICGYDDNKGNVLSSMDDAVAYWTGTRQVMGGISANACSSFDTTADFCSAKASPSNPDTQTPLDEKQAGGCAGGVAVQVYKLWGGTHTWYPPSVIFSNTNCTPTSSPPCNPHFNSSTATDLNDIIWNFFASHPKPISLPGSK
jgi:polyhydroxybutyrate depolymerase